MGLVHHPNVVSDGLIGCWDAANKRSYPGAGTTWTDLAGSNSATLVNDATFADVSLGAIAFDGTNDSVTVPIIDGQNGFSFSIWLYFLAVPTDNYTTFSIYNGGGAEFMFYIMETSAHTTSYMLGIRGAGTGNTLTSTNKAYQPSSNLGKWVHYCATYNGGGATTVGNYKVYFNGQVTDINLVENFGGAGNQDPMKWGQDIAGYGDLNGYMGHIAFYNRALSADEVSQNYEATKSRFAPRITKSGLVGNWDAGDPQCYVGGDTCKDTARGIIGTLQNATTFDSANGGCWGSLDGTDEFINTNSSDYTTANGFTGMAWVNLGVEDILNSIWWNEKFYMLCYDPSNQLRTRSGDGSNWSTSTDLISSADLLTVDQWAFVASTINTSDGSRKIFVDGASVASDTGTGMGGGTNSCNMGIGGVVSAACGSGYWRGKIAHALLYERALSDAEIKDFYNKTKARFGH